MMQWEEERRLEQRAGAPVPSLDRYAKSERFWRLRFGLAPDDRDDR